MLQFSCVLGKVVLGLTILSILIDNTEYKSISVVCIIKRFHWVPTRIDNRKLLLRLEWCLFFLETWNVRTACGHEVDCIIFCCVLEESKGNDLSCNQKN